MLHSIAINLNGGVLKPLLAPSLRPHTLHCGRLVRMLRDDLMRKRTYLCIPMYIMHIQSCINVRMYAICTYVYICMYVYALCMLSDDRMGKPWKVHQLRDDVVVTINRLIQYHASAHYQNNIKGKCVWAQS